MGQIKNICIVGVGGVGGYFGGTMIQGLSGNNKGAQKIYFVARGGHLREIQKSGLILNTPERANIVCIPALATDRIDEIPAPDLCLLSVKSYDLLGAVRELVKIIREDTVIVPLLNGIDIYERVRTVLKQGIVLPACVYVGTHIERPGVVTQRGGDGIILCGKEPGFPSFNPENLITFFQEAGVKFVWNDDPYPAIWQKYIFIAAFGLVTAYSGKTLGEVVADHKLKIMAEDTMREIKLIADKSNIGLPDDIIESSLKKADNFPFETKTSYQRDIERAGRNEGDLFGGTILRMSARLQIPTPVTEHIYFEIQKNLP